MFVKMLKSDVGSICEVKGVASYKSGEFYFIVECNDCLSDVHPHDCCLLSQVEEIEYLSRHRQLQGQNVIKFEKDKGSV